MTDRTPIAIDSNILLRHLLQDHSDHSPRASQLMLSVRKGQQRIFCPSTVIFEAIHILHGRSRIPKPSIASVLKELIQLPSFLMAEEHAVVDALGFWAGQPALDYADCYHLALTRQLGMTQIYSYDKKMDRYPGVERVEPESA